MMFSAPQIYSVWPGVIPADQITRMTITSNERAFLFPDGERYQIVMISVNSDENYYAPHTQTLLEVTADRGVLTFSLRFPGEQEHSILLKKDEKILASFSVYSLRSDLYALAALKGDLHSHSSRSDGTRDAAALAGFYRENGFDFVALTDHNRYFPGGEIDETYEGVRTGLTRVFGEEVHCPGSVVHIVHVGGRESVADRYVHDRAQYEKEVMSYLSAVPDHVPDLYKERYAKARWAVDAIHAVGGLAIFPHPFWRPNRSKAYNVCEEFARILLTDGLFDAYELLGHVEQGDANCSVALWADLRADGLKIPVVGSSDTHALDEKSLFSYVYTICFSRENSNEAILEAVKNGNCVAVEATSNGNVKQYRCYGSMRLVSYAQFLLKQYFPIRERLSGGIGVAMRAFAMNEAAGESVALQEEMAERFRGRFFGKFPILPPSEEILAFEEKWRAIQKKGPLTRGSSVDGTPSKNLI